MGLRKLLDKYFKNLSKRLLNKTENKRIIRLYTYAILFCICVVMTTINIFTNEIYLGISTAIFGLCCGINFIIQRINKKEDLITQIFFALEFLALLLFFIIFGYPGGFSILWVVLVPPITMLFYKPKYGILFSLLCFLILIFFLWIPFGQELVSGEAIYSIAHSRECTSDVAYSEIFRLRFPVLYLGTLALAIILEAIKSVAYKEIEAVNDQNKYMSEHDILTGLYNRNGIQKAMNDYVESTDFDSIYIAIMDIDSFKPINDTYGHLFGDYVLKEFATMMTLDLPGITCRWGGDEFAFIGFDNENILNILSNFKDKMEARVFRYQGREVTTSISIGVYIADKNEFEDKDECLKLADKNLYQAKQNGKNLIIVSKNV